MVIAVCALGTLSPSIIHCGTGARRSREEYLAEVEFVSTDNEFNGIMSGYGTKAAGSNGNNGFHRVNFESGRDCGSPSRVDDTLVYKFVTEMRAPNDNNWLFKK